MNSSEFKLRKTEVLYKPFDKRSSTRISIVPKINVHIRSLYDNGICFKILNFALARLFDWRLKSFVHQQSRKYTPS